LVFLFNFPIQKDKKGLKHVKKDTIHRLSSFVKFFRLPFTKACPCIRPMGAQRVHWPSSGKGGYFKVAT